MSQTTTKSKPSTEHAGSSCSTESKTKDKGSCGTHGSKGSCG